MVKANGRYLMIWAASLHLCLLVVVRYAYDVGTYSYGVVGVCRYAYNYPRLSYNVLMFSYDCL